MVPVQGVGVRRDQFPNFFRPLIPTFPQLSLMACLDHMTEEEEEEGGGGGEDYKM
jgi:hypothetical protein